jgi:hypothetical protein
MTKPRVPNTKAKTFGQAPKAGNRPHASTSRRAQTQSLPPLAPDGTRQVPFDEAVTEPRVPFARRHSNEPPTESAKGDDDAMNQPQTVVPG